MIDGSSRRQTKVERVIDEYDLESWGDRLEAKWVGDGTERTSLRDLAAEFNRAVLRAAVRDAGGSMVESDIETLYRTLTDDDVSAPRRSESAVNWNEQVSISMRSVRTSSRIKRSIRT